MLRSRSREYWSLLESLQYCFDFEEALDDEEASEVEVFLELGL